MRRDGVRRPQPLNGPHEVGLLDLAAGHDEQPEEPLHTGVTGTAVTSCADPPACRSQVAGTEDPYGIRGGDAAVVAGEEACGQQVGPRSASVGANLVAMASASTVKGCSVTVRALRRV